MEEKNKLFTEFNPSTYEDWKEEAIKLLKGKPFEKALYTKTPEEITLEPIYNKKDLLELEHINALPGEAPFVRGTKIEGELVDPWIVSQNIYASTPKELNEALKNDLKRGETAISFTLDNATLALKNGGSEGTSEGGVSISTLKDLEVALEGIDVKKYPFHIVLGANPIPFISILFAYLKKNNINLSDVKGILAYDPLGYASKTGDLKISLTQAYDNMAKVIKYLKDNNSSLKSVIVESHVYHNGGVDSVNELSFVLLTLAEYVKNLLDRGISIEDINKSMVVSVSLGSNFFMQISKVRALKMLYANLMKSFGAKEEDQKIYIHAKTSSWTKTVYDPYVNMLRNASEAFSGAIANVDSLEVVAFDEAIRPSDEFSRRVSRNVQYFLLDEAHVNDPIDPAGGSWYVEVLTDKIAKLAWEKFAHIIEKQEMSSFIKEGLANELVVSKYEEQFKDMARRKKVLVGINQYANIKEEKLDKNFCRGEAKKLREEELKSQSLKEVEVSKCINEQIEAALNGASIENLQKPFNEEGFKAVKVLLNRSASRFEELRDKVRELKAQNKEPKVFLANIGPLAQYKPRADFSRGFFEVGEFSVIGDRGFDNVEDIALASVESKANLTVICSTDKVYPEYVPAVTKLIKQKAPNMKVFVAGRPSEDVKPIYDESGVDGYIYMGSEVYGLLEEIVSEVK